MDSFHPNTPNDMTLERIILAYFDTKPMGTTSYLEKGMLLEEAHDAVLCDLMKAHHQLDAFREQLLCRMGKRDTPGYHSRAFQLGSLTGLVMTMMDDIKREIDRFTASAHDQS